MYLVTDFTSYHIVIIIISQWLNGTSPRCFKYRNQSSQLYNACLIADHLCMVYSLQRRVLNVIQMSVRTTTTAHKPPLLWTTLDIPVVTDWCSCEFIIRTQINNIWKTLYTVIIISLNANNMYKIMSRRIKQHSWHLLHPRP